MQGEGPLKRSVSDDHHNVVDGGLVLQNVMDFVGGESSHVFSVDL